MCVCMCQAVRVRVHDVRVCECVCVCLLVCTYVLESKNPNFFDQNPGYNNNFLKNPNPMKIPQILQNPKSNEF